jgi:hypothetical protein
MNQDDLKYVLEQAEELAKNLLKQSKESDND